MNIINENNKLINKSGHNRKSFSNLLFDRFPSCAPECFPGVFHACSPDGLPSDLEKLEFIVQASQSIPLVLEEGGADRYILLTELPDKLNEWIYTGKTEELSFRVLSEEKEKILKAICRKLKYKVMRGIQVMEYMGHRADIEYLRITDPKKKTSVALIPWFMLPRKKYPVFTYLFAYLCCQSLNLSERESAAATEELFGTGIHYSVVNRNLKTMQELFDNNAPIPTTKPVTITLEDIFKCIPVILSAAFDQKQPQASGNKQSITALEGIALRFGKIIRPVLQQRQKRAPPTASPAPRKKAEGNFSDRKQEKPRFFNEKKVDRARKLFILMCRRIVLNAAIQHQILLL